jgi:hypothetical protein
VANEEALESGFGARKKSLKLGASFVSVFNAWLDFSGWLRQGFDCPGRAASFSGEIRATAMTGASADPALDNP